MCFALLRIYTYLGYTAPLSLQNILHHFRTLCKVFLNSRCNESELYSLSFGQAVAISMYKPKNHFNLPIKNVTEQHWLQFFCIKIWILPTAKQNHLPIGQVRPNFTSLFGKIFLYTLVQFLTLVAEAQLGKW